MFAKIAFETYVLITPGRICSNIYLIESEGKKLLIDAGDGSVGLDFKPDVCILTHGHFDHTAGVKPDWHRVLLHPDEFDFKGPYIKIPKNAAQNPMEPIRFGKHILEFFHTPGHTQGSICVLDKKTGALFSGDTLFADGIHGRTDLGGDEWEMLQSLKRLKNLPYKLLCPGHGEIERNGQEAGKRISKHEESY
ncbi:MAG: MBL fold metallo-hydrolase [Candidatus Anstonellaceae archaeon]